MNELFDDIQDVQERSLVATATYQALRDTGKISSHLLLTCRCAQGRCTLLHVVGLPQGAIFGWPRYRTSPQVTSNGSNHSGRRANTEDGERRWKTHAAFAQDALNVALNCDHIQQLVMEKSTIQSHIDAGHAEILIHRDGSAVPVLH